MNNKLISTSSGELNNSKIFSNPTESIITKLNIKAGEVSKTNQSSKISNNSIQKSFDSLKISSNPIQKSFDSKEWEKKSKSWLDIDFDITSLVED